jgi:hypothetical protein
MAPRSARRASDPNIGFGIMRNPVIELDGARNDRQAARSKELNEIAQGRDLSSGYLALTRNTTLAGRNIARPNISRPIIGADDDRASVIQGSRIRQVGRLRKKEKWLMWKLFFEDFNRLVGGFFASLSPAQLFKSRDNNLDYEAELAKYLQRVEMQKDAVTCDK